MRTRPRLLLWLIPTLVLVSALVCFGIRYRTLWPWLVVVHEDGRRTLLGAGARRQAS
ncbi:MAG: hypothetical protein HY822_03100 [Acidobacteria bacterium]|nr:hypothetical protein [Acidobacteriota bacterium]